MTGYLMTGRRVVDNMPWYVKATYTIGVPAAIACFLIYKITTTYSDNQKMIIDNVAKVAEAQNLTAKDTAYLVMKQDAMTNVLIRICYNTSKTQAERNACLQ